MDLKVFFLWSECQSLLVNRDDWEKRRRRITQPNIPCSHPHTKSMVSDVPLAAQHYSTAPSCFTCGVPSIYAKRGQYGTRRHYQRQDSNAVYHQSSFSKTLANGYGEYSFISHFCWLEPHNATVHGCKPTLDTAPHKAVSQWPQKAEHFCVGMTQLFMCDAWMAPIHNVQERESQNLFLSG